MADEKLRKHEIPLDGKCITSVDPSLIGHNFQTLTNLRYYGDRVRGIGGMTKITSSVLDATYFKARSAIHFAKDQPSESHVLVEAFNTGLSASRILQNTTAIPSSGNFSATSLYSPSGSSAGRWSAAPDGDVAYCNGEESCIWGGLERRCSGFVNYAANGSFWYDYTREVQNTKTDASNIATLNLSAGGIDGNVMLMLHLDNNVTDNSPATVHTVTNNNVTFSASDLPILGSTHKAVFTTNAYLTIPDDADFDLSGGVFTFDGRFELDDTSSDYSIYYQNTASDNDSFNIMVDTNGAVLVRVKAGGTKQFSGAVDFKTPDGRIVAGNSYHIQVVENGNSWYIFINGSLQAYTSDSARAANYTGLVQIGYDGTTYLEGQIDELRLSDSARNTVGFVIPSTAYTTSTTTAELYLGSVRPIDGFKFYIGTPNVSSSSMFVWYWNGSTWTSISGLSDGTDTGASLAQTGTVTFDSTVLIAKLTYINGVLLYWYKIHINAVSDSTSISYITVQCPFQPIKDIWGGGPSLIDSFQLYDNSSYQEATLNVRENTYVSTDTGTYVEIDSMAANGVDYYICGFTDRMSSVTLNFVAGKGNTTAGTVSTVKYWNGGAWTTVGRIADGTIEGSISHAKTGTIAWESPASTSEFTQSISNSSQLYYYRFETSKALSGDVQIYYVSGIPAPKEISDYKFPFFSNDRLFLCCDEKGKKNSVIYSAQGSSSVFNGSDSSEVFFGDEKELMGAAWLYAQYGSSIFNVSLFFKKNETWALIGTNPEDWIKFRVSSTVGCVDPETIKVIDLPPETAQTLNRTVAVWRSADGIYMSDGRAPIKLSDDIDDKFDKRFSTSINNSVSSAADWDGFHNCYHWMYAAGTSTTLDKEWVLDFTKPGWFEIDRTSTKKLQYMIGAEDTNGANYNYGFIDTGYMLRLDYGNDFDGQGIAHTFQLGDMAPVEGSVSIETKAEYFGLIAKSKTTTSSTISLTHYADSKSTGTSWAKSTSKSGYRLIVPVYHGQIDASIFHSIKCTISTDNETYGFEPLYLYILYRIARDHLKDWRT